MKCKLKWVRLLSEDSPSANFPSSYSAHWLLLTNWYVLIIFLKTNNLFKTTAINLIFKWSFLREGQSRISSPRIFSIPEKNMSELFWTRNHSKIVRDKDISCWLVFYWILLIAAWTGFFNKDLLLCLKFKILEVLKLCQLTKNSSLCCFDVIDTFMNKLLTIKTWKSQLKSYLKFKLKTVKLMRFWRFYPIWLMSWTSLEL